ncbi:MAG: right-handed parallel beta-helix repeat-containing protein [Candidatus Eisenbacteria sp.]|nr:right-handed parallel beta-helix repeat-containing protein [Candidatus Eisenbacteria bacterium]
MARKLMAVVLLVTAPWAAQAETLLVHPDGSGTYPTIQAAVDAAGSGDVIELTSGTFTGPGNRDIDYLGKAITIRSQSGNPDACIIACGGSDAEHHRGFRFHSGEGPGSALDGLTITGGYAPSGAAIYCSIPATPTLTDCVFHGNTATGSGGGLYCGDALTITDCVFSGNSAANNGGAAACGGGFSGGCLFVRCLFRENHARYYGGVDCSHSSPTLLECTFIGNTAEGSGAFGGIWSVPTLTECTFINNTAATSNGACFVEDAYFTDCIFVHNVASNRGGAVSCLGMPEFTRCTFSENEAPRGAVLCIIDGQASFEGCTLTHNRTVDASGAIEGYSGFADVVLQQTIVAFTEAGCAIHCTDGPCATLWCSDLYGNEGGDWVGDLEDQLGSDGNVSDDPLFCWPDPVEAADWSLHSNSPCAPPQSECGLMGAWDVGCGPTAAESPTWGGLKALFREATD